MCAHDLRKSGQGSRTKGPGGHRGPPAPGSTPRTGTTRTGRPRHRRPAYRFRSACDLSTVVLPQIRDVAAAKRQAGRAAVRAEGAGARGAGQTGSGGAGRRPVRHRRSGAVGPAAAGPALRGPGRLAAPADRGVQLRDRRRRSAGSRPTERAPRLQRGAGHRRGRPGAGRGVRRRASCPVRNRSRHGCLCPRWWSECLPSGPAGFPNRRVRCCSSRRPKGSGGSPRSLRQRCSAQRASPSTTPSGPVW